MFTKLLNYRIVLKRKFLSKCYVGDTEVLLSFFNLFLPIAYEVSKQTIFFTSLRLYQRFQCDMFKFNPELVIISTNFNLVSESLKVIYLIHYLNQGVKTFHHLLNSRTSLRQFLLIYFITSRALRTENYVFW